MLDQFVKAEKAGNILGHIPNLMEWSHKTSMVKHKSVEKTRCF